MKPDAGARHAYARLKSRTGGSGGRGALDAQKQVDERSRERNAEQFRNHRSVVNAVDGQSRRAVAGPNGVARGNEAFGERCEVDRCNAVVARNVLIDAHRRGRTVHRLAGAREVDEDEFARRIDRADLRDDAVERGRTIGIRIVVHIVMRKFDQHEIGMFGRNLSLDVERRPVRAEAAQAAVHQTHVRILRVCLQRGGQMGEILSAIRQTRPERNHRCRLAGVQTARKSRNAAAYFEQPHYAPTTKMSPNTTGVPVTVTSST